MNRRILMSLGAITFVAAVSLGATGAFFSDSETSTGNTFTAGAIDLRIDSQCHYFQNGQDVGCEGFGNWQLKDLIPTQDKFFNFGDVKPGDWGENTLSLHIDSNPAYACVDITNVLNNDNGTNTPEMIAGDVTAGPIGGGELGQNLNFLVWLDQGANPGFGPILENPDVGEGNNVWQEGEPLLTSGTAPSTNQSYALAEGPGPGLPGGTTGYLGVAWCAGTWSSLTPGATCSGALMNNIAQTDSYSADVGIRVEQSRNNGGFRCTPPVSHQ